MDYTGRAIYDEFYARAAAAGGHEIYLTEATKRAPAAYVDCRRHQSGSRKAER
jgi:hypothetical protein